MLLGEVVLVIFISTCFSAQTIGHSHSHGHAHSDEPPHLKYTREVNEAAINDHEHIHDDDHQHHNEHDHEHEHHGCGGLHHHGGEPHMTNQRMASTLPKIPTTAYKDQPYSKDGYLSFLNNPQIRLWTYAVGSTLLISAFPCFLLAFIPVQANIGDDESPLLRTLLAFGAGGLLGDAFLHLIPHSTPSTGGAHSHSHSHSHGGAGGHSHEPHDLSVGTWVLVGFMTFFIVEKFVRIVRGEDSHGHSHGQSNSTTKNKAKQSDEEEETEEQKNRKKKAKDVDQKKPERPTGTRIRVAAYLNLVADFMHNFTDGLAIGASFIAGPAVGFVTMITVLVHEVPHEIGDFAILVQSGISKPKAMLIQLCTALGALAGCILSLWDVDAAALVEAAEQSWAIPFTAGGFIYIGTVSMVPDLLEQSTAWQSVKEIIALLLGLAMMYAIAFFE